MSLKHLTLVFLFLTGTVILSTSLSFADPDQNPPIGYPIRPAPEHRGEKTLPEHRGEKPPAEHEGEIPATELEEGHDHPYEPPQPHDRHLLAEDLERFPRLPPRFFPPRRPPHYRRPHKPPPHLPPHKPPPHFPPHKPPPHFPPHKPPPHFPPHKPPTAN